MRSKFENVIEASVTAVEAGANIISIADTTGYMIPGVEGRNMYEFVCRLKDSLAERGANPKIAIQNLLQKAFQTAFNPSINRVAILGIVSIPGLLAGMIIGGENPIVAAVYQVIIFLMIQSAGLIAVVIVTYLLIQKFFTPLDQINYHVFKKS